MEEVSVFIVLTTLCILSQFYQRLQKSYLR